RSVTSGLLPGGGGCADATDTNAASTLIVASDLRCMGRFIEPALFDCEIGSSIAPKGSKELACPEYPTHSEGKGTGTERFNDWNAPHHRYSAKSPFELFAPSMAGAPRSRRQDAERDRGSRVCLDMRLGSRLIKSTIPRQRRGTQRRDNCV